MEERTGTWFSYGPGGPGPDPPDDVRQELTRRKAEREKLRGRLQAIVQVYVYENGVCDPQVSFSAECALGPDSDAEVIDGVVRTARGALADWR